MANLELQAAVQGLADALCDAAVLIKSPSVSNALAAGEALLSDSDLKLQIGTLIVNGLSGLKAGLSDVSNLEDDLQLVIAAVPMIQKVVAALKA